MTLLETERLVRKIADLLQQTGTPPFAPKLAEDFAGVCHAANLRLQQCEAMIKAGDRPQAIQLAETQPNLLDLVTVLEFRQADEWRAFCQQNALAVADKIDARSVHALNECYAQGITTDHPLYANYRRAVLSRNDDDSLKALQSITRLNPTDANAASEQARLDAKVLAVKLEHLGHSLAGADSASVVAEVESIEAFGFKTSPDGEIWRKAQTIRSEWLLKEAACAKEASFWVEALSKIEFIHRLQDEFKLELPSGVLKQLETLETWAKAEQDKDRKEREFKALLAELNHKIHLSEEKDTSARYIKLPELRDDNEALHKVWRALTDFTRPIPAEATAAFRKRSALLEAEIARRTSIHRRIIVAGTVGALVCGAVIVWIVLGQMKARDFAAQLQEAINQRQAHTAEKLLDRLRNGDRGLLKNSRINAVAAAAETFVGKENSLLANYETSFNQLPRQLSGDPQAARLATIASELALAQDNLNALAPDLKAQSEPSLRSFEKQWQNYLVGSGMAVNNLLNQWVSSAEKQAAELDYRIPLEKTVSQIAILAEPVRQIRAYELGFSNRLDLRGDLLQRSAAVQSKYDSYVRELKKLNDGMDMVRKARAVKEFSDGINLMASSEFSTSPAAVAAVAIQQLNTSEESMLRALLGATNASAWAFIRKGQTNFIPELTMPSEQQIFKRLRNDPAVSGAFQHYRLWLDNEGTKSIEWITAGSLDSSSRWQTILALEPSETATSAQFVGREYGYFDGHYKLSPSEPIYRVESLGVPKQTAAYDSIGLEKVWSGGDSCSGSLLEVLDSIKDSHEGSPLFRAYLFQSLVDLMKLQPDAWGLTFCPAARAHEAKIINITGGPLNSGDWFAPAKVKSYGIQLEELFASVKGISYAKQANGLLALARAASKDGLQYVGWVGLDGKPAFIEGVKPEQIWGYNLAHMPVFLGEVGAPFREQAMLLSPLFSLTAPPKELLANAGINSGEASFQGALPPLFQHVQSQP